MIIPYTTATTSKSTLAILSDEGWRLLVTPETVKHFDYPAVNAFRRGIDNGAWSAFKNGRQWNEQAFVDLLSKFGDGADFVIAPDVVCGGMKSLDMSIQWLSQLEHVGLVLVPVQDGMTADHLRDIVSDRVGLFVGGSTEWKEKSLPMWAKLKYESGCYMHVGRVNSGRRITMSALAGAESFDGSGWVQFPKKLKKETGMLSQPVLFNWR